MFMAGRWSSRMTLKEIAVRVGTSVSTVSVVLNNKESNVRVSEAKRKAILDAARELGYTPNIAARRLRQGGNLVTVALYWSLDSRFPLLSRVLAGVERFFETERPDLSHELIIVTYKPGDLARVLERLVPGQYNGMIIGNSTSEDDRFLESWEPPAPMVRFQRFSQKYPAVNSDGMAAGRLIADYLTGLGHRRIGLLQPYVSSEALTNRSQGFLERMEHLGLAGGLTIAQGPFTEAGGVEAARSLLTAVVRPTAIVAATDTMAFGALFAARRMGISVPSELSVIGFDDSDRCAYYDPPLTTVRVPIDEMAREASRLLMEQMQHRLAGPLVAMFSCELVIRESCAPSAE
jgi:LacI family transcriptional regulator